MVFDVGIEFCIQLGVIGVDQQVIQVVWQEGQLLLLVEFCIMYGGFVIVDWLCYIEFIVGWIIGVYGFDDVVID